MTREQTVEWLTQEMSDYLDAGSVGLYEFVNELNDPEHPMPLEARKKIAREALARLLGQGNTEVQVTAVGALDNRGTVASDDPWRPGRRERRNVLGEERLQAGVAPAKI
jgi:hypothetical protein